VNKAITRLFMIGVVLFVAVIVNLTWIMAVRADWYADRPENKRGLADELRIKRGDLLAFDGSVLATSRRRSGYYYRAYPQGVLAPHLLGYSDARYGRSGLEKEYNAELTGQTEQLNVDYWVDKLLGRRPEGADVKTTLVPAVQKAAQSALGGRQGAVVVLDPATGALIASASAPSFDPRTLDEDWQALIGDDEAPLLNRVTQGLFQPGSAFKVVTAAAGLDAGEVTPSTVFVDTGTYRVGGGKVTNFGGAAFGRHDFTTALALSINTTFAKVGNELGRTRLVEGMQAFGFYEVPPLALPQGEIVASGRYRGGELLPVSANMDELAVAWAACGQEQILATPLQMALVAAAVANDGRVMKPYVMQTITSPSGEVLERAASEEWMTAMSRTNASSLTTMMERVVTSGSGSGAAIPGVRVAGKTGTAERGDGTNLAWFICFAPANDPQVAVAVVLENVQTTGGAAAAPIAADVMRAALAQPALP
jgi:peptidoglycan glycosyltransferase